VPDDVAVAGHNDAGHNNGDETRWVRAPLTTIPNPAYEMGRQGAEAVLAKIAGAAVPDTIVIPAQLIVRQSCGCLNPAVVQAGTEVVMSADELPGAEAFTIHREAIVRAMVQAVGTTPYAGDQAGRLFDAFAANLNGPVQDAFLTALHQVLTTDGPIAVWQNALSELRRHVRPHLKTDALALQAETLWHQARVIIGEMAQRFQDFQALQTAHHAQALRELEQALISTFDVQELMDTLVEGLPRVGIAQCFLSLYEDPARPMEWARLMLAYDETGRVALEPIGRRFLSRRLVPDELWPLEKGFNLVAEALYFHEQQLGFILFKVDPREGVVYETLRGEISSALQGALLMQRVQHHAAEIDAKNTELRRHQNHLQERIAERTAEITQINACLRDEIVERKRVEQVLLVNEQQYRLLAENNKDGLVIVQANRIVFVNKALAAMFSTSVDRLLQSDPRALFSDGAQCLLAGDVETEAVGSPRQIELVTNTGRTIWTEIAQTTIVWNTQNALLLTIRNINQSKLRELRLEAERVRLRQENLLFKSAIVDRCRFGHLIGKSAIMQQVYDLIISAASSDANVLIAGESGTGKELIARTIHQVSWRKAHPFVPVNCASIPETLFEREFFGHRKGTFTGADRDTPGLFDKAHRGTLFLDEVSELTPATQAKLLRVLQDGQYTPLGSATPKQADVLIVAATNKNCQEEIAHGRLREDFFYRIGVIELAVPPLRDRKDDLPVLIEHILEQYRQRQLKIHGKLPEDVPADHSMLPGEFIRMLYVYDWPGNVRELQNVLQRYLATRDLPTILSALGGTAHPRSIAQREQPAARLTLSEALKALERQMIAEAWERTYHHIGKTAELLGMPRRTLQNKLIKYQLR
jgi:PAS domain S-box-containing protein